MRVHFFGARSVRAGVLMVTARERGTRVAGYRARDATSLIVLLALAAASTTAATAQRILHEWRGIPGAGDSFGAWVSSVGDLDADGTNDLAISAPSTYVGTTLIGRVYVFSGRTRQLLFTVDSEPPERRGFGLPYGDFDQDGHS